jgi:hypothetical protein
MSSPNTNPFVLPGLGQDGNLAGNPLLASMEMMSKAWAGLAGSGGLAQTLPMTPPMSVEELDRRIGELRTVENWLRLNLSMLSSTIQGMEVQRATIATLKSFVTAASGDGPSPLEIVLGLKPAAERTAASEQTPPASASTADSTDVPPVNNDPANIADQVNQAAQTASQAWWGLLQQQFNQIASATASTMPGSAAVPTPSAESQPEDTVPKKRAARKTPAKRAAAPRKS